MCISSFFSATPKSVEAVYELTCQTILWLLKPVLYQNIPLLRSCTAEVIAKILTMPPATSSRGILYPAYCELFFSSIFVDDSAQQMEVDYKTETTTGGWHCNMQNVVKMKDHRGGLSGMMLGATHQTD